MRKGFTLIELLVVITLIGILTAVGLFSYQTTNRKARDGRRQSDLEQIRTALEIYRSENSFYPNSLDQLVPDYSKSLPSDPRQPEYDYYYLPSGDNTDYELCAHLELDDDEDSYCGLALNCGTPGSACNYSVVNP
jgi:general secretion pathway protein G